MPFLRVCLSNFFDNQGKAMTKCFDTAKKQNSRGVLPWLFRLGNKDYFTMTQPLSNSMVPL